MRRITFGMFMLAAVAGLVLSAAGQVAGSRPKSVTMGHPAQAARLPYTAEYKISSVKTLANGTTITHESTEVRALDSEGRVMTSRTTIPVSGDQTARTHFDVFDPVARTNTFWDSPGQRVTVTAMPAPGTHPSCSPIVSQPTTNHNSKPVVEDLGVETVLGIEARGRRTTTTISAGAIGNDAPLTRINETWSATATGLRGLLVREATDNGPQSEKMNKELVNFNQAEPEAEAFQPPPGYEIVNMNAPQATCAAAQPETSPTPAPQ
jgi:hypothetical protein